jgi:Asp-tRNA(Asn)/Glu-tRNA(Gln) amidotransferase B subunit
VGPAPLADLLKMIEGHEVTANVAKEVLAQAFETGEDPAELVRSQGLGQVSDTGEIAVMVDQALAQNAKAASDYQAGNDRALGALVGAVMKMSQGRANADIVNQLLHTRLPRPGG